MCSKTSIIQRIGIQDVVSRMLSVKENHTIVSDFEHKGFNLFVAKSNVTKKHSFVLPKTYEEHERHSLVDPDEIKDLIRFAQDKKGDLFVAHIQLGSKGDPKTIQKIPLQRIPLIKRKEVK